MILKPEEVSKAIGRGGHNIRLAGQLTGYEIDVYREGVEEDVELTETEIHELFSIGQKIIVSKFNRKLFFQYFL